MSEWLTRSWRALASPMGLSGRSGICTNFSSVQGPRTWERTALGSGRLRDETLVDRQALSPLILWAMQLWAEAGQAPQPATAFASRYSSNPNRPHSRPLPECL